MEHSATPSLGGHVASEGYFEGGMTFNRFGGVAFYREVMSNVAGFLEMENETALEISKTMHLKKESSRMSPPGPCCDTSLGGGGASHGPRCMPRF